MIADDIHPCESAGCKGFAGRVTRSMTAYHFEGERNSPEDPNRDMWLCPEHSEDYVEHWSTMWDEYYASQGI